MLRFTVPHFITTNGYNGLFLWGILQFLLSMNHLMLILMFITNISEEQKGKQKNQPRLKHIYGSGEEKCTNCRLFTSQVISACTVMKIFLI